MNGIKTYSYFYAESSTIWLNQSEHQAQSKKMIWLETTMFWRSSGNVAVLGRLFPQQIKDKKRAKQEKSTQKAEVFRLTKK